MTTMSSQPPARPSALASEPVRGAGLYSEVPHRSFLKPGEGTLRQSRSFAPAPVVDPPAKT